MQGNVVMHKKKKKKKKEGEKSLKEDTYIPRNPYLDSTVGGGVPVQYPIIINSFPSIDTPPR